MIPLNSTEARPLKFTEGALSQKMRASTAKIGWLHSEADQAGAKFDIVIKDGHGHIKFQRKDCGNDTPKFGELVNLPTLLGEDLNIEVSNIRGAKEVNVFLN